MAKWENETWTLKVSVQGSGVDLKAGAKNSFKLVPTMGEDQTVVSYTLEPQPANSLKAAWVHCKLVPQKGLPLTRAPRDGEDPLDPDDKDIGDKIKTMIETIRAEKLDELGHLFERLVGTMRVDDLDHSVTFYQVPNLFNKPEKILLIAEVKRIVASPNGVVGGNN